MMISSFLQRAWRPFVESLHAHSRSMSFSYGKSLGSTIFALSSGCTVSTGVSVVRVSGSSCRDIIEKCTRAAPPIARRASVRTLINPTTHHLVDRCIMIYFEAPSSFTGEDILEIHAHGSPTVVASILSILDAFPGCRRADAGEFTKRAVLNGKMSVLQAEGIADIYSARTPFQLHLAHSGSDADNVARRWRQDLISCLAHCEAVIDFTEDVECV
jgi:tRNA modification GTPase